MTYDEQEQVLVNYAKTLPGKFVGNRTIICNDPALVIEVLMTDRLFGWARYGYKIILDHIGVETQTDKWEAEVRRRGLC